MCQAAVPGMRERGWGRVVAITSLGARQPMGTLIASSTARAAVTAFLKVLFDRGRWGRRDGQRRPAGHPPDRPAGRDLGRGLAERAAADPAGRLGDADDLGAIVAMLCSEQAGFVIGAGLHVDGGANRGLQ